MIRSKKGFLVTFFFSGLLSSGTIAGDVYMDHGGFPSYFDCDATFYVDFFNYAGNLPGLFDYIEYDPDHGRGVSAGFVAMLAYEPENKGDHATFEYAIYRHSVNGVYRFIGSHLVKNAGFLGDPRPRSCYMKDDPTGYVIVGSQEGSVMSLVMRDGKDGFFSSIEKVDTKNFECFPVDVYNGIRRCSASPKSKQWKD